MELKVDAHQALADQNITIKVAHAKPKAKIQLRMEAQDADRQLWFSSALFEADEHGDIDVARDAPISGDYSGVDPMGLMYAMRPQRSTIARNIFSLRGLEPIQFTVRVRENDAIMQEVVLQRQFLADDVSFTELENDAVSGMLFRPKNPGAYPAIAMIPGSGGIYATQTRAALMASKGYVVLVIGYSGYKNLSPEMYEIPLEILANGIRYLAEQDYTQGDTVIAYGISKGAEGLLATLSYIHDLPVSKVILLTPSSVIWQGIGKGKPKPRSTWSFQGKPLGFLQPDSGIMYRQVFRSILIKKMKLARLLAKAKVAKLVGAYDKALQNREAKAAALIPVANITIPVLMISGGDDELWPSQRMANDIADMLEANAHVEHVSIPDMGHMVQCADLPTTVNYCSFKEMTLGMGGTPAGNYNGAKQALAAIMAFIAEQSE